ncbi:UNVERIFIED_ASMBLY: sulfurtransferase FdhD, partial [Cronobacter sakazakii]
MNKNHPELLQNVTDVTAARSLPLWKRENLTTTEPDWLAEE